MARYDFEKMDYENNESNYTAPEKKKSVAGRGLHRFGNTVWNIICALFLMILLPALPIGGIVALVYFFIIGKFLLGVIVLLISIFLMFIIGAIADIDVSAFFY